MRVLFTGAGGQVGQDFRDVLSGIIPSGGSATALMGSKEVTPGEFEVFGIDHASLDVSDASAVQGTIEHIHPDVIVHLAAYTAVDRAETDAEGAYLVNAIGTRNVAQSAERVGAHMVYVSTDYVFAGDKGRALVESDETNPLGVYGATKLAGEQECPPSATIARTAWVAGLRGKNLFHLAAAVGQDGRELRFVDDQIGSPTAAADLAAGLVALVRERPPGLFHVAGSGEASWFEAISFAVEAAGGSRSQVSPITSAELDPQPAAIRPAFSALVSERLASVGLSPLPEWQDGIGRLVAAIIRESSI